MKNTFKNIIAFIITIIFILSGIFLVKKSNQNVVNFFLESKFKKDELIDNLYEDNLDDITSTNQVIYESNNETTYANQENNENDKILFLDSSTKSEINTNIMYRRTYIDPKNPDIMHVIDGNYDKNFFKNSLFIGDSRVDGLKLYANVPEAHYFCSTGLTEYTLFKEPLVVANVGNIYLEFLIASNNYDKIFFQMGINSLGSKFNSHVKEYENAIRKIHELSPSSKIYIISNMHVINKRSEESKYITNKNIDLFNNAIMQLADNESIYYIDVNKFLDDEKTGVLNEEYTKDGVHLLPKYYDIEMDVFYNFSR